MTYKDRPIDRPEKSIRERLATLSLGIDQIRAMQSINDDKLKQIRSELVHIRKSWWILPDWFWFACLLAVGGWALYFHNLYALIGGLFGACYSVAQLAFRFGFQDGYIEGCQSGHKQGVNTVLGITPEVEQEMWKIETETRGGRYGEDSP